MQPKDLSNQICSSLGINPEEEFMPKWRNRPALSIADVVESLITTRNRDEAVQKIGLGISSFKKIAKSKLCRPDKFPGKTTWCMWLLRQINYCRCRSCDSIKPLTEYYSSVNSGTGYHSECKACSSNRTKIWHQENKEISASYSASYRAAKIRAIVPWADLNKIREIYQTCPKDYHVDHIYPLNGEFVCGLHVENNLRQIPSTENLVKGNKMPSMADLAESYGAKGPRI